MDSVTDCAWPSGDFRFGIGEMLVRISVRLAVPLTTLTLFLVHPHPSSSHCGRQGAVSEMTEMKSWGLACFSHLHIDLKVAYPRQRRSVVRANWWVCRKSSVYVEAEKDEHGDKPPKSAAFFISKYQRRCTGNRASGQRDGWLKNAGLAGRHITGAVLTTEVTAFMGHETILYLDSERPLRKMKHKQPGNTHPNIFTHARTPHPTPTHPHPPTHTRTHARTHTPCR